MFQIQTQIIKNVRQAVIPRKNGRIGLMIKVFSFVLISIESISKTQATDIAQATSCTSPVYVEQGDTCADISISTNEKQDQINYGTIITNQQLQSIIQSSYYPTNFISFIGTIRNYGSIEGILNDISTPTFLHPPPISQPNTYGSRIDAIENYSIGRIFSDKSEGITNPGIIGSIRNDGSINSVNSWAIGNGGVISLIENNKDLIGAGGIGNEGFITSIINSSRIESQGEPLPGEGAAIGSVGSIGTITNSGLIISNKQYGIGNGGTIDTITNSGIISATDGDGINNRIGSFFGAPIAGVIGSIDNQSNGTISGFLNGIANSYQIENIYNSGSVSGETNFGLLNAGSINSINNSGLISGYTSALLNYSGTFTTTNSNGSDTTYAGQINNVINSGTIKGYYDGQSNEINDLIYHGCTDLENNTVPCFQGTAIINAGGAIDRILNLDIGVIQGSGTYGASAIWNKNGYISTIENYGLIDASDNLHADILLAYPKPNYGIYSQCLCLPQHQFTSMPDKGLGILKNYGIIRATNLGVGIENGLNLFENSGFIESSIPLFNMGFVHNLKNTGNIISNNDNFLSNLSAGILNDGNIENIDNQNNIEALDYGILNLWNINSLTNSGKIIARQGDAVSTRFGQFIGTGIEDFSGTFNNIENRPQGIIQGYLDGITNSYQIGTIKNYGEIVGSSDFGILNAAQLNSVNNSGVIKGQDAGIMNYASQIFGAPYDADNNHGTISSIINSGIITGYHKTSQTNFDSFVDNPFISHACIKSDDTGVPCGAGSGIINQRAQIGNILNTTSGIIETKNNFGASGIWNKFGYIGSITNYGKILSLDVGQDIKFQDPLKKKENYGIFNFGYFTESHTTREMIGEGIGNLNNIGIISAIDIAVINSSGIKDFSNSGTINGAVVNSGYIESLVNSGKIISETVTYPPIGSVGFGNDGNILSLENTGSISGKDYGLVNLWNIDSLVNKGILSGGTYDLNNLNPGLESFTNGQGGNGSGAKKTALTYSGILPTSYYIYVTSKTQYGQVAFSNVTGSMNFDIASGSVLSTGTYSNVLSGIDNTNLANLNGSFGARSWSLVNAGSKYNLVISAPNSQDMSTIPSNQDGSKTIPSGSSAKIAQLTASDNITIGSGGSLDDSGTSDPVKVSGGSLKVESGGTVTTAIKVQGGSVEIASGGTLISEDTVTVTDGSLTVGGTINAPIALSTGRKFSLADLVSFSPVFTLSSGGTVIGPLTIDAAGARVNGTIQGSVTIGDGAALRGTGIITGESTVSSGGILAPGNSPGIMTFTASLTQGSGSTLSLDIDGTTAGTGAGYYSQVLVTGSGNTYTIGSGATIQPNLRDITGSANNTFTPSIGDVFTVVSADGGVSGTFSTLTQPSSGLTSGTRFIDLYTSTEVQLKVVKSGYSTIGSSTNSNLGNVGSAIDSISGMTGDRSTLMNAIFALSSDTDSTTALKQLSGDIQTVSPIAAVQSSRAIGAVVDNRMASVRGGTTDTFLNSELFDFSSLTTTGTSQVVGSIIKGFSLATDQEFSDSKPWMKVLTCSSSGSSDSNGLGVNSSTVGAAAGIDYTLNSKGFVGAAIGVASNSITNGQTVITTSASLYGSHDIGSAYIASRLSFALDDYRGSRSIDYGTISRTASANTYGYQLGGAIELGNRYRFGAVSGELYGSFESGWLQRAAYTESGADSANLTVDELKAQTSTSKLGVRLNSILNQTESGSVQAFSDIAWGHDFGDTSITSNHTLMGSSFSLEGPNVGRDSAEIGFGIVSENKKGYRFFAKYAGEFRKMEVSRTAELGVTMIW